eukprot:365252-Chlamydomonas_euryale.AAC.2
MQFAVQQREQQRSRLVSNAHDALRRWLHDWLRARRRGGTADKPWMDASLLRFSVRTLSDAPRHNGGCARKPKHCPGNSTAGLRRCELWGGKKSVWRHQECEGGRAEGGCAVMRHLQAAGNGCRVTESGGDSRQDERGHATPGGETDQRDARSASHVRACICDKP